MSKLGVRSESLELLSRSSLELEAQSRLDQHDMSEHIATVNSRQFRAPNPSGSGYIVMESRLREHGDGD